MIGITTGTRFTPNRLDKGFRDGDEGGAGL